MRCGATCRPPETGEWFPQPGPRGEGDEKQRPLRRAEEGMMTMKTTMSGSGDGGRSDARRTGVQEN